MQLNGTRAAARWYLVPFGLALAIILVWVLAAFVFVGAWDQFLGTILSAQRSLQQDLSGATRAAAEHGFTSAWTLIGLSFAYGVLHAAGPGHGKFVISTYLLSHESAVPRSLLLATLSALMQGVTAIVIIEILVALLGIGLRQATGLADNLEVTSYALVILIGVILSVVTLRRFMRRDRATPIPVAIAAMSTRSMPPMKGESHPWQNWPPLSFPSGCAHAPARSWSWCWPMRWGCGLPPGRPFWRCQWAQQSRFPRWPSWPSMLGGQPCVWPNAGLRRTEICL